MRTISQRRDAATAGCKAMLIADARALGAAELDKVAGGAEWPPPPGRDSHATIT